MCGSSAPKPAPAPVIQPPEEKRLELNPNTTSKTKKQKKLGTKRLQIPLKEGAGSGLKI